MAMFSNNSSPGKPVARGLADSGGSLTGSATGSAKRLNNSMFNKSFRTQASFRSSGASQAQTDTEEEVIGVVGCMSWQIEIRKDRRCEMKFAYLDPLTGKIFQQGENQATGAGTFKSFLATHIVEISYINDESISVTIKMPSDVMTKSRVYTFANARVAAEFKTTIEYINEFGEFIKFGFKAITRNDSGTGIISAPILQAALLRQDIHVSSNDVTKMICYAAAEGQNVVTYLDFFKLFPSTYVRTIRECLLEWLRKVRLNDLDMLSGAFYSKNNGPRGLDSYYNHCMQLPPLMPGEKRICNSISSIRWSMCAPKTVGSILYDGYNKHYQDTFLGSIHFTNYRIIISSTAARDVQLYGKPHSRYYVPDYFGQISIPLNSISKFHTVAPGVLINNSKTFVSTTQSSPGAPMAAMSNQNPLGAPTLLYILCKDVRVVKLVLYPGRLSADALLSVSEPSTPSGSVDGSQSTPKGGPSPKYRGSSNITTCTTVTELVSCLTTHAFPFNSPANVNNPNAYMLNTGSGSSKSSTLTNGVSIDTGCNVFAFKYRGAFEENGWDLSDVLKDYVRQGLLGIREYRVVDNTEYKICETYPTHLIVPSTLSTLKLGAVVNYRSSGRIPVVTYFNRRTKSVLVRCAQPLPGVTQRKCAEDIEMLNAYRLKGNTPKGSVAAALSSPTDPANATLEPKLYIVDVRSYVASSANVAKGGGVEDVAAYGNAEVIYGNVDNIHTMRSSLALLSDVVAPGSGEEEVAYLFHTKLDEAGWMKHVRQVLTVSVQAAEKLHLEASSVVVHCSDGWDRTAQVCALVQVMVDPYYRTLEGLAVLIEKEWCSFGYKFQHRCGHGLNAATNAEERSPVFVQFLDCLMQIMQQFPNSFEYNTFILVFLADHLYSGLFGNFLGNSDRERRVNLRVHEKTQSLWSYVYEYSERFVNQHFEPYFDCIWPTVSVKHVTLWERYFCRWDVKLHPNSLNIWDQWHDDWGNGYETVTETKESSSGEVAI